MPDPGAANISGACQRALDDWCNAVDTACVDANKKDGYALPLVARHDRGSGHSPSKAWRCYSPSSLSPDLSHYSNGSAYCTANPQLEAVLAGCREGAEHRAGYTYCPGCCWGAWTHARPDAIALHIGTNDIGDCYLGKGPFPGTKSVSGCAEYLEAQLDRLLNFTFTQLPRVRVFLATIIAMPQYEFYNQTVQRYNAEVVPAAVTRYRGRGFGITLVPVHALAGICTPSDGDCCGDLVHPTGGIGYPRMAKAWFGVLNASSMFAGDVSHPPVP